MTIDELELCETCEYYVLFFENIPWLTQHLCCCEQSEFHNLPVLPDGYCSEWKRREGDSGVD